MASFQQCFSLPLSSFPPTHISAALLVSASSSLWNKFPNHCSLLFLIKSGIWQNNCACVLSLVWCSSRLIPRQCLSICLSYDGFLFVTWRVRGHVSYPYSRIGVISDLSTWINMTVPKILYNEFLSTKAYQSLRRLGIWPRPCRKPCSTLLQIPQRYWLSAFGTSTECYVPG